MSLATVIWIASIADNLKIGAGIIGCTLAVVACVLLGSSFDNDSTNPSKQCCATIGITEHATGSFDVHVASTVLHEHMNTLRLKSSKDVDKLVWECYDDLVTFAHKYPEPGVC